MIDKDHMMQWIWQRACDDGSAYVGDEPQVAMERAFQAYLGTLREEARENWRQNKSRMISDLAKRWMESR